MHGQMSSVTTAFEQQYKHHFEVPLDAVLGVEAPTGAGKSTGLYNIISKNSAFYGRTIFVFPTYMSMRAIAKRRVPHIISCTPKTAIDRLVQWNDVTTVVLDEAHFPSKEYYSIYCVLAKQRQVHQFRCILLSATLDRIFVLDFFPDAHFVILGKPVSAGFNIDVRYRNDMSLSFAWYPCFPNIATDMMRILTQEIAIHDEHHKVLCFVATHDQCEKMRVRIQKKFSQYPVIAIHGGMTSEEIDEARATIDRADRFICIATNIAETAITFRGIDYVIDSGIRCVVEDNMLVVRYCDQVSMIQRAGRTGRTNDGTVFRVMSEAAFASLPYQCYPIHNFDHIVLRLYNLAVDPLDYLDEEAVPSMERFVKYGLVSDGRPSADPMLMRFLETCGLQIHNGLMLHRCITTARYHGHLAVWIIMAIAIIDHYESKYSCVIYFPDGCDRFQIRSKIRRKFLVKEDLLLTLMNIMFTVFASPDPKAVAAEYSFNFKTLRGIMRIFHRLLSLSSAEQHNDWQALMPFVVPDPDFLLRFQLFFQTCPHLSVEVMSTSYRVRPNEITYNAFTKEPFIPLVTHAYEEFSEVNLFLMIIDYRQGPTLKAHVRAAARCRKERRRWKTRFDDTVQEIADDVAHRPGFYRFLEKVAEVRECIATYIASFTTTTTTVGEPEPSAVDG